MIELSRFPNIVALGQFPCLMALLRYLLSTLPLFLVVLVSASVPPALQSSSVLPNPLQSPPAWTAAELDLCSTAFSYAGISPLDCLQAFQQLPSGSSPVRFINNAPRSIYAPQSLPLVVSYRTCAMKFEASGRNASNLPSVMFIPDQIREMAAWVTDQCVLPDHRGGFVTRQIDNTKSYLQNPDIDVDFTTGFRE